MIVRRRSRPILYVLFVATALVLPACGGGGAGGAGPDGAGQGLVLVKFLQAGQDNVPLNRVLSFEFSEPVDPGSINAGSLQILAGPNFGETIDGDFIINGAAVEFRPRLPSTCSLAEAGLRPDTQYRVMLMGHPEEFSVKNTLAQPLERTLTYEFHTRPDTDPDYLEDQIPAAAPRLLTVTPADGDAAVAVMQGNEIVVQFTENLDPCTVNDATILVDMWQRGDPTVGFVPANDTDPSAFRWGGSAIDISPAQRIPSNIVLIQDYGMTEVRIQPAFGVFPENALLVVQFTFGIQDFGGDPLSPVTISFTTENLPPQSGQLTIGFDEPNTPKDQDGTTADFDTARSPDRVQGWLLFAGDGDNGSVMTSPAFPGPGCTKREDGQKDDFKPTSDVVLNTGTSRNSCANDTDGSTAVVWSFRTFEIPAGITVRLAGVNPAIIRVQGSVTIYSGGTLRVRGDASGVPDGRGDNGQGYYFPATGYAATSDGGTGIVGGGDGGRAFTMQTSSRRDGEDGYVGYGSPDYGVAELGGVGAGHGTTGASSSTSQGACGAAGGGGGHAVTGVPGMSVNHSTTTFDSTPDGAGGGVYPENGSHMYTPSAGSGAGGGGALEYSTSYYYRTPGGGGGAGGGFVDITAGGDILVYGTIDAAGSRGGNGGKGGYGNYLAGGGGGGGSGGGVRLLTPGAIDVTGGTISTAGGTGGPALQPNYFASGATLNHGGSGGHGRIVLEDGDTTILGLNQANVLPGEGLDGFFRGQFDATRFQGGGNQSTATTGLMLVGPLSPATFAAPTAADFEVYIPAGSIAAQGDTAMLVEIQGYDLLPDGQPDLTTGTGWHTVGYFADSGSPGFPTFVPNANPGDVTLPPDNIAAQPGVQYVNGSGFVQIRVNFYLKAGLGATDPGPYVDTVILRFTYDQ